MDREFNRGDEVFVRANTFVATIQAIEEERFIFTNTALTLGQGDHLLIKNVRNQYVLLIL